MAKKSDSDAIVRGTKLIKKAIEAGKAEAFADPEPVASAVLKKMTLPNGESLPASLKELLKVDALWLGIEFDDEEGDIESVTFEEAVEDFFGEDAPALFEEAVELFDGDCILIGGANDALRVLYVGEPDESGEYAVLTVAKEPKPWIELAPFDIWVAQEVGVLPAGSPVGAVPPAYEAAAKQLAEATSDGRTSFEPVAGAAREKDDDDEDEDEDEDEDDEDGDGEDAGDDDAPADDEEGDAPADDDEEA